MELLKSAVAWLAGGITGFMKWLAEPRRTPGEQWAIDHRVHDAWRVGYAVEAGINVEVPNFDLSDDLQRQAFRLGKEDAAFDAQFERDPLR